ncbi:family 1 putative carbohydrate esterase [Podospora fimiseda]|uniref:Carboxylic ester hydrolase n=1 Tax=Podospora fimiseda TaxID=252190 RepID=A0AAN6YP82_9PEZI|nr:family 1 putative carbohydrate esterase [Podospora fimiseda]
MLTTSLFGLVATATTALGASLQQVQNWGTNPTRINMHIYVPDKLAAKPPIVVALHPCGGNAPQWFSGTRLPSFADQNGFILIYPSTPNQSNCWDVHNPASLTHGAGGDALGIVNQVNYTITKYNADRDRVYVMGFSSGGMMTNVLAGSYPEVWEAGAAYSGTAHACFAGSGGSTPFTANQTCAQGLSKTPQQWASFVYNSYPGYTGRRPRMQITHGNADTLVRPACAQEALKQWSQIHGVSLSRTVTGVPSAQFTQQIYGDGTKVQGFFGNGVGHAPSVNEQQLLRWFGLIA